MASHMVRRLQKLFTIPKLWDLALGSWRFYDAYQRRTEREIPVVRLDRIGA